MEEKQRESEQRKKKKSQPWKPQVGEITEKDIFPRVRDSGSTGHSNPEILHRKVEPPKYLALKTNKAHVQEIIGLQWMDELPL